MLAAAHHEVHLSSLPLYLDLRQFRKAGIKRLVLLEIRLVRRGRFITRLFCTESRRWTDAHIGTPRASPSSNSAAELSRGTSLSKDAMLAGMNLNTSICELHCSP